MPCTTILVGKKASIDGSTIISRNDDGSFEPKRIAVMLPEKQPRIYKSVIAHLELPLPDAPLRYTYIPNVIKGSGIWPACGINAQNVAMTATETITTNPRVLAADPLVCYQPKKGRQKEQPGGIGEEDLVMLVLPYIRSAREGVLRLGELLERYGTYESNGIAFSDTKEIWWMETVGGHHWLARRVPDDRVVIMPNQFGMDGFDFEDAENAGVAHLCAKDLRAFTEKNHLDGTADGLPFNPRLAYGSRKDSDHIYNTPRAWFMARYFLERSYRFDGENADFTPESNDIPWSFVPERKVSVEDVRYLLGSFYQGTPYNPYDMTSAKRSRYRVIGVPNSDDSILLQLRGDKPFAAQGVQWVSLGGSGFTACFPLYAAVSSLPAYVEKTGETVSSDSFYWQSRLLAALTDAHYAGGILLNERYVDSVWNKGRALLAEYDARMERGEDGTILAEANRKIADAVKAESDKALKNLLNHASEHMKTRYHRGDT